MGLMLAEPGFHTRCFVEWEEYPRRSIIAAQRAGYFAPAPIWDDVTTFDGRPFRGAFDAILAGYPCQPFSQAGQRRGADDERHLWPDVARIIREVEPEWVFLENVAGHVSLGAETVLRELWDMGWTPAAGLFSASETGAPHERLRWFCVAHRSNAGSPRAGGDAQHGGAVGQPSDRDREEVADSDGRNASAERQLGGGQQRLLAEGGGTGAGNVEDSARDNWGIHAGSRPTWIREADTGRPSDDVGNATRLGCGEGRAEPVIRGGRDAATVASRAMADTGGAEREGQQPGQRDARGRQEQHGHSALPGRTGLFPPGPGDADAWAAVLRSSPDMAPSAAARDLHAWARRLEADGREWWQAEAEPEFRRLVDGLADRSSKLRLLGNGVVPLQAAYAWRALSAAHGLGRVDLEAVSGDAAAATDDLTVRAAE